MSASFDAYKIFYYVGKYKNITHAAGALFLSQSTVSRAIQSLESDLGCRLMERSQHGVILTAEGEILYGHVARACEEIMLGEQQLKSLQSTKYTTIRLGADSFVFNNFILPLLKDFRRDFPDVRLEFSSHMLGDYETVLDSLRNEEVDAAFTLGPIPDTSEAVAVSMGEYNDIFIAGKMPPAFYGPKLRIYDLSLQDFGALNHGAGGREYLRRSFALHGLRVEPGYQVDDLHQLFSLVDSGMCLALIPSPLLAHAKAYENIFTLDLSTALPPKSLYLLISKSVPQNPAGDELIKRIRKLMQSFLNKVKQE